MTVAPIPFVEYHPTADGIRVSRTDYDYGYRRALEDGVVRPVLFLVYAGHMRWRTRTGDEMEAQLGQDNTKDITAQAWRTALDLSSPSCGASDRTQASGRFPRPALEQLPSGH